MEFRIFVQRDFQISFSEISVLHPVVFSVLSPCDFKILK